MNKKRRQFSALLACAFGLLLGQPSTTQAQTCWLSISPPNDTATIDIEAQPAWWSFDFNAADNPSFALETILSDNAGVPPGPYLGWCIDVNDNLDGDPNVYSTTLYSSCDTNIDQDLPNNYPASVYVSQAAWHEVNYILNHKNGAYFYDIQVAIWNLIGGPIPDAALEGPTGPFGAPPVNLTNVANIVADATNNAANWQESCGDVIAVVVGVDDVTPNNQLTIIEVPYPCVPCVNISKTVACYQPTNNCGDFGKVASGYAGAGCSGSGIDEPAFCYQISITNCGTIPLTNLIVSDNLLGLLTTNFFSNGQVLPPGAGVTSLFSMSFSATATNTVTVTGDAALANQSVTNIDTSVVTNGQVVGGTDSAVAQVDQAQVTCDLTLTSPNALPGSSPNDLILPQAAYYSTSNMVTLNVRVSNTGQSMLTNLTITVPSMASFTCTAPGSFTLAPGGYQDFQLCMATVSCPAQPSFSVSVNGQVAPDATHCAVYDTNSAQISVCSACTATITCSNECVSSVSGTILVHCNTTNASTANDSPLAGVPVTLLTAANAPLASTTSDVNGNYSFSGLAPGLYYILVSPPANYVETYPAGNTNNEVAVTIVCANVANVNFGYADTVPPMIMVPPGSSLGCNPANIPTSSSIASMITAAVSCGSATTNITCVTTNSGCLYTQVFTVIVTDTYGNSATNYVTNTWTADTTPPMLTGVPIGTNLGCNPTNFPTVAQVQASVKASDTCSPATVNVTVACSTNSCAVTQIFTIIATNACKNMATAYVTNTWTIDTAAPMLSGIPTGQNLGCNPASIPTVASVQAAVKATDTCSSTTVKVLSACTTNGCAVTQIFTITATNVCGNMATAYVTNTWTADSTPPVLSGLQTGKNLGCNPTNVPTLASVQASVKASDTCSPATVVVTATCTTNGCGVTQVFTIIATNACKNMATAYVTNTWQSVPTMLLTNISYTTNVSCVTNSYLLTNYTITTNVTIVTNIVVTTNCCTNSICGSFNWQNPGSGWLWFNSHASGNPGKDCFVYCQNASVTLACTDGKTYSFPIPNGTIHFSTTCTVATNWFDGSNWNTTLPCAGDSQIFLQGCGIPWQSDFANCQSVCWTATFCSSLPGFNCNWQWGAACYSGSAPACGSIAPKACQQNNCPNGQYYNSSDYAGCPENYKPNCWGGGTGSGGNNCTGSWAGTSTTCVFGTKTNITTTPTTTYMTNATVSTAYATNCNTTITTNTAVITAIQGPVLSGVPTSMNFGCNPTNIPTVASVTAQVVASASCSTPNVQVTVSTTTNGCLVTQFFTIMASNACGGITMAYVTNMWTADTIPPVITGVPPNVFLGCNSGTNLPNDTNVLSEISATDQCSTPSVTVTHVDTTNGCTGSRTFTITATDACGNVATTNLVYTWTGHTPDLCTNILCAGFNSKNPGSGWLWCNAHISGNPGKDCTLYCQNASVTLNCTDGKSYTYPVPNGTICFRAACNTPTNWFDGTNWNTTLPCAGDDQIFLQGCAVPWRSDFANCQSVCWTGVFSCDTAGLAFNWQWGAACFANSQPAYTNICPKACHQTACPNGQYYSAGDCAGTPENHKPYCVAGGTSLGGTNCTGSWSGTDTTCTFTPGTSLPPVLNGVPANDNLGINPTNIPTVASVLAVVTATDTCSPAPVNVCVSLLTNACSVTQIFTITATNDCGNFAIACVTNTWTTLMLTNHCTNTICSSFNSQNPGSGWLWFNSQLSGKPGTNEVLIVCSNAYVTLNCNSGKSYTFPIPCGTIHFAPSCTVGTNWFDGTNWNTLLPCGGDDQIFLAGCSIPWQADFAGCRSVCWTGDYSCNVPGLSFNWQFGAACYSDNQPSNYGNVCPKACHQTTCFGGQYFNQSDNAGTPENHNPYCVGGGTGYGGANCTGSFSNPGTCNF